MYFITEIWLLYVSSFYERFAFTVHSNSHCACDFRLLRDIIKSGCHARTSDAVDQSESGKRV